MDDFEQYMLPFDERPRSGDNVFVVSSLPHRLRCSAVLPWSRASAVQMASGTDSTGHAGGCVDAVPCGQIGEGIAVSLDGGSVEAGEIEPGELEGAAMILKSTWGSRRSSADRLRCGYARGRRVSHRVTPLGAPRDPNHDCRVSIDYAEDGFHTMTMQVRGEPPVVVERSESAADLVFGAGKKLQPGLKASVSEAAMLGAMLGFQVWSPREMLQGKPELPRVSGMRMLRGGPERARVAEVGFRHLAIEGRWVLATFGPFRSREQLRLIWKREGRKEGGEPDVK